MGSRLKLNSWEQVSPFSAPSVPGIIYDIAVVEVAAAGHHFQVHVKMTEVCGVERQDERRNTRASERKR
jgi:hypothetical protein